MSPVARATDPSTSWDAADSIRAPTETQCVILSIIEIDQPCTDETIWDHLQRGKELGVPEFFMSPSRARTARHELVEAGLVEFSGEYGQTMLGRKSRKWRLTKRAEQLRLL